MKHLLENKRRITKDQLVTIEDLEQFKSELTETITKLLKTGSSTPSKPWLKSNEVRKLLGISAGKLLTLRINGVIPFTKIGGVIYYKTEDIHNLFNSNKPVV